MNWQKTLLSFFLINSFYVLSAQTAIDIATEGAWIEREFPQTKTKFTFAIIGDKTTGDARNWPIFDRAVDEINRLHPDFAIMPGDLIQGYVKDKDIVTSMWKEFREHANRLNVPLFILPGNHDISNTMMYDYWAENIGLRYYAFKYNNVLFLLLNTEEYRKTGDGVLGAEQLSFIKDQLQKKRGVSQIFIFLHRPQWGRNGLKKRGTDEWKKVLSWLPSEKTTVFAAHWHNLFYQKIENIPHIILSATGGRLKPKTMPELGYFHHYTLVTVDGDSTYTSIIKPGAQYSEDIANAPFLNKLDKLVDWNDEVLLNNTTRQLTSTIDFTIVNRLNRVIDGTLKIDNSTLSGWTFNRQKATAKLEPGDSALFSFKGSCLLDTSIPFPRVSYTVLAGRDTIRNEHIALVPKDETLWCFPKEVLVSNVHNLNIKKKALTLEALPRVLRDDFEFRDDFQLLERLNTETGSSAWKTLPVKNGKIDFDKLHDDKDFSLAFVKFSIRSTQDMEILTAIKPDNYCKVYLNNEKVFDGFPFRGVPNSPYLFLLPLKQGNNEILLKTADFYGNWYTILKMIDPQNELSFGIPASN